MDIERIVSFDNDENCYILYDETKQGAVIDPGTDANIIYDRIKKLGIKIKYILLTHCHYDHIEGLEKLRKITGAEVCASFECNLGIQNPTTNLSKLFSDYIKSEPADVIVSDGDTVEFGNTQIKVITTPGHTKGGVCYLADTDLFSGDTLFLRSVGRTDFPGGDSKELEKSIREKIYTLDDDTIVHPGHGNDTKVYYEKRYNMYVSSKE